MAKKKFVPFAKKVPSKGKMPMMDEEDMPMKGKMPMKKMPPKGKRGKK